MRRTLLAIGLAVLASTLFAPHHDHWSVLDGVRWKSHHEAYYTTRRENTFDQVSSQKTVNVVGHGRYVFPAEMTNDQIRDVLGKAFPSAQPSDEEIVPKAARDFNPYAQFDWVLVHHPAVDIYYKPDWVDEWKWYPAFWPSKSLLLTPFIAQTVFLATLAAVLVNLRQKKSR